MYHHFAPFVSSTLFFGRFELLISSCARSFFACLLLRVASWPPVTPHLLSTLATLSIRACTILPPTPQHSLGFATPSHLVVSTGTLLKGFEALILSLLGDLRWRAPQTPTSTAGVQQATEEPAVCYQASYGISKTNPYRNASTGTLTKRAGVTESEDCLFLK